MLHLRLLFTKDMNSHIDIHKPTMKRAEILILLSLFFGYAQAQVLSDPNEPADEEQVEADDGIGARDHGSDNAFLNRYKQGDNELDQLSLSINSKIRRKLILSLESSGNIGSGDFAPFWFTSNRQGLSPTNSSGAMLKLGMDGGMILPSNFKFNYGMEVAVAANYQSGFYLHQIYVEAGYKWLDLSLGAKERWGELVNPALSSGSLTWSGNSRPIPQIRLEVPEFTRLSILGHLVSLKGHIAYGWYQDSKWRAERAAIYSTPAQYTDRILHHSKSFFIRIGDSERFPLEFTGGIEMYARFGGVAHNIFPAPDGTLYETHSFPSDIKAYLQAFLPVNKPGEQTKENGNSYGSWHASLELTMEKWKYRLYYEHFFEDHSSMLGIENKADMNGQKSYISYGFKRNWLDGLFGIEVTAPDNLPFKNIVFEVLNTRGQCGSVCNTPPGKVISEGVDGCDGMYDHSSYKGTSNYGYYSGSPILISPIYNKDGNLGPISNRALMFHLGIDGMIASKISYRLLMSHASHWGTYYTPLQNREETTSILIEGFYHFKGNHGWRAGLSFGGDFGSNTILGNNKGIMLTVSRNWRIL